MAVTCSLEVSQWKFHEVIHDRLESYRAGVIAKGGARQNIWSLYSDRSIDVSLTAK